MIDHDRLAALITRLAALDEAASVLAEDLRDFGANYGSRRASRGALRISEARGIVSVVMADLSELLE